MRPDFNLRAKLLALFQLGRRGVNVSESSCGLSELSLKSMALLFPPELYPAHDGIIGNNEYRPEIDPLKPIHMESPEAVRKGTR